jgi:arginyl-tRNA synthetase
VITGDLRRAIARAAVAAGLAEAEAGAGTGAAIDPGLRPGGAPGRYASSVAFGLAVGDPPRQVARRLAVHLAGEPWLDRTEVSGPGFLALTVTSQTLAALPGRISAAGPACARGDALAGVTLEAPPPAGLPDAPGWEEARRALAAELTVRLAAAAGAKVTVSLYPERTAPSPCRDPEPGGAGTGEVAAVIGFAGADAVRFWLARAVPGRPVRLDAAIMARHAPDNPAYAVRYAHARAASGVRWAAISGAEAGPWRPPADQGELALLDALSWLPERVAVAARRGRPDEFARYLEQLASVTIAALSSTSHPGSAGAPGSARLALASAARAGLAAGLGLLGVSAPDRL